MTEITSRLSTALADRYRIERHLGEGGMATVYLAHDLKHDRPVALKVLRPELAAVLGAERFVQEIKTTANLQHPHILPLFDSGEADGFLYYVMPFIDGETLRDKLNREKQLGIEEAVKITTEVADSHLGEILFEVDPERLPPLLQRLVSSFVGFHINVDQQRSVLIRQQDADIGGLAVSGVPALLKVFNRPDSALLPSVPDGMLSRALALRPLHAGAGLSLYAVQQDDGVSALDVLAGRFKHGPA